jgi:hypothetical protein
MTGILPNNGVPPGSTQNGIPAPVLAGDCENQYYGPRCNPRMDPFAMNALISEVINALNAIGIAYDCERLDNLATAFLTMNDAPVAVPSGAPAAILQHRLASGVPAGIIPATGVWVTRPLNVESYDPGGIVTLAGDQFTVAVNSYITWNTVFFQTRKSQSRIFNVTDGVVVDVGMSGQARRDIPDDTTFSSDGSAFLVAGKTYRLEVFCENATGAASSLGKPVNAGVDELYAWVRFWRLA